MRLVRILKRIIYILVIIVVLFGLFLVCISITDYRPDALVQIQAENCNADRISSQDSVFTFLSWNIGYAGLGKDMDFFYDGGRRVRPYKFSYDKYFNGIKGFLKSNDTIDFMLIQEIDIHSKRSFYNDQFEKLGALLKAHCGYFALNYDVRYVPVPLLSPLGRVKAGMASFSRFRAEESFRFAFEDNYSWPKRLFLLDRCFIMNRYKLESGKDLVVINTHNSAFDDGSLREAQMEKLKEVMTAEYGKGHYVVAGGDWNLNPAGWVHLELDTGYYAGYAGPRIKEDYFPEAWKWVYDKTLPTNRSLIESYSRGRTPVTTVDFFIVSPNIQAVHVQTIDLSFDDSDHQPVVMKIKLEL